MGVCSFRERKRKSQWRGQSSLPFHGLFYGAALEFHSSRAIMMKGSMLQDAKRSGFDLRINLNLCLT